MLEKDEGIVLRTFRSGETSQVFTFLGRGSGKIRLIAKGALGAKSPWRGLFEAGNHVEVVYYLKPGRSIYFVREASLRSALSRRRDSLPHLATLLSSMELLDHVCYPGSADERIVDIAVDYARHQDSDDPLLMFLAFELKLLSALGAEPDVTECSHCGAGVEGGAYSPRDGSGVCREHRLDAASERVALDPELIGILRRCIEEPFSSLATVEVPAARRKELGKLVHWTYTFHVHGYTLPKSLNLI